MQHHDAWFTCPASSVTSNSRKRFIYHFLHLQRNAGDNRLFLLCTCTKPGCIVHILGRYGSTEAHMYTQRCKPLSGVFVLDKAMRSSSLLKRGAGMSHVKHTKQQQQKSFNNIHTENWCIQKNVLNEKKIISFSCPFEYARNSARNFYFR